MKPTTRIMAATTLALSSVFAISANAADGIPARLQNIYKNAADICAPVGPAPVHNLAHNAATSRLRKVIDTVAQSPTGKAMLDEARAYDGGTQVWACMDDKLETGAQYYPNTGVIGMASHDSDDVSVWNLAHEIRHFWQEQHADTSPDGLSLGDRIALSHAVEADAEAIATLQLWELKEQGITGPWAAHNDPGVCVNVCYTDISAAFAKAVADGHGVESGIPAQRAYDQWYADATRRDEYAWDAAMVYMAKTEGDLDISLDEVDTTPSATLNRHLSALKSSRTPRPAPQG